MKRGFWTLFALTAALCISSVALAAEAPAAVATPDLTAPDATEAALVIGQQCGGAICGKGTYCCNPTCSLCLPFNMSCTQQVCNTTETSLEEPAIPETAIPEAQPQGKIIFPPTQCGNAVCGSGEFCCNESCSTCAPLGGACTQQYCPPVS